MREIQRRPSIPELLAILLGMAVHMKGGENSEPGPLPVVSAFGQRTNTLVALAKYQVQQARILDETPGLAGFTFSNRYAASGIQFSQQPVDDGARTYKAVHYDHGTGVSAADVDGDGRIDLYFVNQLGGNGLFRNLGGGRFEDITSTAGVAMADKVSVTASFADIDNDGRPDLFVTTVRMGNRLFRNLGGGRFEDVTDASGLAGTSAHSSGAVFFDFNRDGWVDLFVANIGVYTRNEKGRGGFYLGRSDAFQGWQFPARSEASVLYLNSGGGKFVNVSAKTGLEHRGWSGDATVCDINEDGFPDLYVLSMSGEDRLYENVRGERFEEKTSRYFPKTPWGSMGVKFFDFNLDGRMDLFVTDMHSDMTSRQIQAGDNDFSPSFERLKSDVWCSAEWSATALQRSSNCILGNAFYRNLGEGRFEEVSTVLGAETYWPWGVSVADLNADGFEDVFVTAGMGYPLRYAINSVLLNVAGRRFVGGEFALGIEPRAGNRIEKEFFTLDCSGEDRRHPLCKGRTGKLRVDGTRSSRSSVALDVDDDGDLDLITNEWNDHPQVFISDLSERKAIRFLKVRLEGTVSNRSALGSRVRLKTRQNTQVRYLDGKSGYLAQSSMPLYFGLGDSQIESIEVRWPTGRTQSITRDIPPNGIMIITEPR